MKKIEQDWGQRPLVVGIALIGGWGLYAAGAALLVIGLLEVVDARNQRAWWIALMVGQVGAVAWAGSWAVMLVVELANWVARKASGGRPDDDAD
jgi:hypothetical protein